MSRHHVASGCRRATSIAYTAICCGPDIFRSVCISAISPVWMTAGDAYRGVAEFAPATLLALAYEDYRWKLLWKLTPTTA